MSLLKMHIQFILIALTFIYIFMIKIVYCKIKCATKQCDFHFQNFYFVNKLHIVVSLVGGVHRDVLSCIYFNCTVAWSSTSWRLISTFEYLLHCCVKMTVTCYSSY